MRIISGELGGRQFEAPPGEGTRPLLDRVRTALFDWLGAKVDDARVLDLYAGSGSQGLEALSRGASRALFVERGAPALATLKRNVVGLGLEERARIVRGDALAERNWSAPGAVAAP
jgi:16S rRNA (guanine966-N2)-methyltransferase